MIVADEALRIDVVLGLPPAAAAWPVTAKPDRRRDELSERGIEVVAISAEAREGSEQLQADWKLERLPIAYGLTEPSDARVGPVRRARSDDEPPSFYEPLTGGRLIDAEDQRRDHAPWLLRAFRDRASAYEGAKGPDSTTSR